MAAGVGEAGSWPVNGYGLLALEEAIPTTDTVLALVTRMILDTVLDIHTGGGYGGWGRHGRHGGIGDNQ